MAPGAPGRAKVAARLAGLSQRPPAELAQRHRGGRLGAAQLGEWWRAGWGGEASRKEALDLGTEEQGAGVSVSGAGSLAWLQPGWRQRCWDPGKPGNLFFAVEPLGFGHRALAGWKPEK